jgi:hypothetical protein
MNAHAQPLRRRHSARLARALERAIPQPLLPMPPLMLALGLLALAPLRINGDTWFGLVAGRDIVQHGLPHSDRLMALTAGRPWQDQQWLSHVASYGLYRLGGLPLLSLVDIACVVAALCIAIQASRSFGGTPTWITAVAGPLIMIQVPSEARAQSFVLPMFAALMWLLARDARTPDRRILLLVPLLALWANLHGSILIACMLVLLRCAVGAGSALRRRTPRALGRHLAVSTIALVAPFASPYGPDLLRYYRSTLTNGAFRDFASEWAGTTFRSWFGPAFFLVVAAVIIAIVRPEFRLGAFDTVCLLLLALLGLDTLRNVVWLPYAAVVLLPAGLARWSPEAARSRLRPFLAVLAIGCAIGVGLLASRLSSPALEEPWPHAEGAAIARTAGHDPALRIVTDEAGADWLIWHYPALRGRIAFDVRFELLGERGLTDVVNFKDVSGLDWDRRFTGYRLALFDRATNPHLVRALLAERGRRVLAKGDGVYAILRPALRPGS